MAKLVLTKEQRRKFLRDLLILHILKDKAQFTMATMQNTFIPSETEQPFTEGLEVLQASMPTFLLVKLGAFLEELLDLLLFRQIRLPAKAIKRLSFDIKVQALQELHPGQDVKRLDRIRTLRNKCAHDFLHEATWDDFTEAHSHVTQLVMALTARSSRSKN